MTFESKFSLYDRVTIDKDSSLSATITAVVFRSYREPLFELSWIANGDAKVAWIEEFRLEKSEILS